MSHKHLNIIARTVNGEIKEFPEKIIVPCDSVLPVGKSIVRGYNSADCIVSYEVYLIRVGVNVFGTEQFNSLLGFETFVNSQCSTCITGCDISYDGCVIYFDGCNIII